MIDRAVIDLALLDIRLPDGDGHQLHDALLSRCPDVKVIVMTGYPSVDAAVRAFRRDAFDFLRKPFEDLGHVRRVAMHALETQQIERERTTLNARLASTVDVLRDPNPELQSAQVTPIRQERLAAVGRVAAGRGGGRGQRHGLTGCARRHCLRRARVAETSAGRATTEAAMIPQTTPARAGLGARLWLFFVLPWRVLFDGVLAGRAQRLLGGGAPEDAASAPEPAATHAEAPPEADPTPALQILAILQREGRFIDFLQEDVSGFSDADIGAAARVVHEGCKRGLSEYLALEPVRRESEGDAVTLEAGFDATRVRVTGNVVGEPPYRGQLAHPGWLVSSISLPALASGHDARVVAPAEVEL